MPNTLEREKRVAKLRAHVVFRAVVTIAFAIGQLFPLATVHATDLPGVLPAALDQPRVNAVLRRSPTGPPLTFDIFGEQGYNIEAFFDTGASGTLLSEQTAELLEIARLRWPDQPGGQLVEFEDVGVAGSDIFNVSEPLYIGLAPYLEPLQEVPLQSYTQNFGPIRMQISPPSQDPLLEGLDIFGMPTMTGKVVVMDPKPTDWFSAGELLGTMHTFVYNPGAPFNPLTPETNPGIPSVDRHIELSYGSFDRFTSISPAGAPGPTLRTNPFIGPNPVLQLDPNPPADDTPGITITMGNQSSTGSWLLDTGAAASMISTEQAARLHVRYRAGTQGTENPKLEIFDPVNPNQPGTLIPDQFSLPIGGIGGTTTPAGFYLDSLLLRTQEGNAADVNDPNHVRYLGAPVLVADISLQDPNTQETITLDGIFGMNMLVGTASFTPGPIPTFDALADGYYNWITFDEPSGLLGLDLKEVITFPPNEWLRSSGGNWGTAANWGDGEVPDSNLASALLGPAITGHSSVDLQATDRTLRNLRFSNASSSYTIIGSGGGELIFDTSAGAASIQFELANSASHTIAAPMRLKSDLDFNGLFDDATGRLTLSGAQIWDAGKKLTVKSGTLRYALDESDQVVSDGDNMLVIDEGAVVELAGTRTPLSGSHSVLATVTHIDVVNNSASGLLVSAGNHAAGSLIGTGGTSISSGAAFSAEVIRQSALSLNAGSRVTLRPSGSGDGASVLETLAIAGTPSAPTATLDVTDNSAIINYTGTSPAATVRQQIVAGRGGAGFGKSWNGMGITSTAAAAANATNAESRSIGYAENSAMPLGPLTTFHGQAVDDTSILMAFTRTGDANLDGVVNDDDVTIVGATYAPGVPNAAWALGDFDYNGFVDDDDVTLLGAFYDPSAPPLAAPAPPAATEVSAVPEPASLMLALVVICLLCCLIPWSARPPARRPAGEVRRA
jgi:hypothetical protein